MIVTLNNGAQIEYDSFDKITDYENIITLDCTNNKLSFIPDTISFFTNLQNLIISQNNLTTLPESICSIESTTNNPSTLNGNLTNLKVLMCNDNKLTTLPESICNLTNLVGLCLSGNKLTKIPDSIGNLTKLQALSVHNNELKLLPASIVNLKNMKEFDKDKTVELTHEQKQYFILLKNRIWMSNFMEPKNKAKIKFYDNIGKKSTIHTQQSTNYINQTPKTKKYKRQLLQPIYYPIQLQPIYYPIQTFYNPNYVTTVWF